RCRSSISPDTKAAVWGRSFADSPDEVSPFSRPSLPDEPSLRASSVGRSREPREFIATCICGVWQRKCYLVGAYRIKNVARQAPMIATVEYRHDACVALSRLGPELELPR